VNGLQEDALLLFLLLRVWHIAGLWRRGVLESRKQKNERAKCVFAKPLFIGVKKKIIYTFCLIYTNLHEKNAVFWSDL
jgi:hypothetical protein